MKIFYEKRENSLHFIKPCTLAFDAHIHEAVEIVYMISGSAHAFSGGLDCTLSSGDFFVVFPNEVHYYDKCIDDRAIVIIPPMSLIPEFGNIFSGNSPLSPLVQGVNPLAGKLLEDALGYKGDFKKEVVRGILIAVIAMILEKMTLTKGKPPSDTAVGAILDFCQNNYKEEISLDIVSESLGISKSHISHIFSDKIHMNFRDYINSLRLSSALPLLLEGKMSITEISDAAGFETIRTFNRAFKKKYGVSPMQYRKEACHLTRGIQNSQYF